MLHRAAATCTCLLSLAVAHRDESAASVLSVSEIGGHAVSLLPIETAIAEHGKTVARSVINHWTINMASLESAIGAAVRPRSSRGPDPEAVAAARGEDDPAPDGGEEIVDPTCPLDSGLQRVGCKSDCQCPWFLECYPGGGGSGGGIVYGGSKAGAGPNIGTCDFGLVLHVVLSLTVLSFCFAFMAVLRGIVQWREKFDKLEEQERTRKPPTDADEEEREHADSTDSEKSIGPGGADDAGAADGFTKPVA